MTFSDLIEDFEPFHSPFQLENLVLARSGHTLYGCYKQALREMAARIPSLLESCSRFATGSFYENRAISDVCFTTAQLDQIEVRDRIREFSLLCGYAIALREHLGDLPQGKKCELEIEFWTVHTKCLMARDLISEGRFTQGTVELIHSLPLAVRKMLLVYLTQPSNHDTLVDWYCQHEINLPKPNCNGLDTTLNMIAESLGLGEQGSRRLLAALSADLFAPH
jgi:hypothetical protein